MIYFPKWRVKTIKPKPLKNILQQHILSGFRDNFAGEVKYFLFLYGAEYVTGSLM